LVDSTFSQASEAAAARWDVPCLALGVALGGKTFEHSVGCPAGTRFRVASITKPMTASLALRLLDLDRATGVWPDDVRVRHLLSHTSGFDSELGDLARFGAGEDALGRAVSELPGARRLVGVERAWSYANTGYWLAGWLAAQAAEGAYEEALRSHVLEPAGLAETDFGSPDVPGSGPGYSGEADYPRARRPSGGLVSTVADLLAFARWQLATPWTNALRVPLATTPGGVYGLGFFGERVGGVEVWGHTGSYGGFQSSLLLVPERGAAIVGLTSSGRGAQALRELEDIWFESLLGVRRTVAPTVDLSPAALSELASTYANDETRCTFRPGGAGLVAEVVEGDERVELTARPIGSRSFAVVGGDLDGYRFDFPLEGFARLGSRLLERLP
jgi:CubicO group peptidase (beta-lactamase class C family)